MLQFQSEIIGLGAYLPDQVISNHDLAKLIDTSDEWIQTRTGIKNRRWVSDPTTITSDLALKACEKAIAAANLKTQDIDVIFFATLSPDHEFPGAACFLQAKLGLPGVPAIDVRQQCSGFLYALSMADAFLTRGQFKTALIVGAEIHSKALDKTTRGRDVTVLFGDGAGACVLQARPYNGGGVLSTHIHADGKYAKELWVKAPGLYGSERLVMGDIQNGMHYPQMNGKTVYVHAVRRMCEGVQEALKANDLSIDQVDLFLFHQANLRINETVGQQLGIPESKIFNTISEYGNTTAATIPIGMHDAVRAGKLKRGMTVACAAFGSGFTWASAAFKY